jgi:hypothetical protein
LGSITSTGELENESTSQSSSPPVGQHEPTMKQHTRSTARQTSTSDDGRSACVQMTNPLRWKEAKGHGVKRDSGAILLSLTGSAWNDRLNERHHATRTSSEPSGTRDTSTGIAALSYAVTRRLPIAVGTSSLTTRRSENSLVSVTSLTGPSRVDACVNAVSVLAVR